MTLDRALLFLVRAAVFVVPLVALVQTGEKDWLFGFLPASHFTYVAWRGFLFRIVVEVMVGLWLILAMRDARYRPRFSWLLISCVAFVALVGVADLLGVDPENSVFGDLERMEGWIGLLHLLGFMVVAGTVLDRAAMWAGMAVVFLGVCVVVCADSVVQVVHAMQKQAGEYAGKPFLQPVPESRMGTAYFRIDARIASPVYLAVYLLFHAFLSALVVASARARWLRFGAGALGVCCVVLLFFTGTRVGIAGLLGGGVTALSLAAFIHPSVGARGALKLAASMALAVVALLVTVLLFDPPFLKGVVPARFIGDRIAMDFGERVALWGIAWQGFLAHPLFGWGQENFHWVYDRFFDPALYGRDIAGWYDRPHNVVLGWLVEAGLLAMLAYLSIMAVAFRAIWACDMRLAQKCLLTGALTGYLLFNMAELDNLTSYVLFFSLLAFLHHKTVAGARQGPGVRSAGATALASATVAAALWVGVHELNLRPLRAAIAAKTPVVRGADGAPRLALDEALSGGPLGRIDLRELLAKAPGAIDPALRPVAVSVITRELEAEAEARPEKVRALFYLGRFLGRHGQAARAMARLRWALSRSCSSVSAYPRWVSPTMSVGSVGTGAPSWLTSSSWIAPLKVAPRRNRRWASPTDVGPSRRGLVTATPSACTWLGV